MARKRRSQTQIYQAKARAKEQRIRRKLRAQLGAEEGAYAWESVKSVSPVRPWSEVKNYTPAEKRSYLRWLKKFISNHDLGGIIQVGYRESTAASTKMYNEGAKSYRSSVNRIPVNYESTGARKHIYGSVEQLMKERYDEERDPATGAKTGRVYRVQGYQLRGLMELPERMEPPKNEKAARRRAETIRKMANRTPEQIREQTRSNVLKMLDTMGDDTLYNLIENMGDEQLDVLFNRTNFMSELDTAHSVYDSISDLNRAFARGEISYEEYVEQYRELMRQATSKDAEYSAAGVPQDIAEAVARGV